MYGIHPYNYIWFKNIYVTQRSDNILSIGATEQERGFDDKIRMDELYFLTKNIWQSFPELENLKLVDIKSGIRSGIVDGNPVMGSIDCISENLICVPGEILRFPSKTISSLILHSPSGITKSFPTFSIKDGIIVGFVNGFLTSFIREILFFEIMQK